jgi:catechol 2,3-dioxygenase-like lactoylglutathione lyase family enzyme
VAVVDQQAAKEFIKGRLTGIDHITIPVKDLEVAERFYAGALGGEVVGRPDWEAVKSGRNKSAHLSVRLGGSPRIDLFMQDWGQPQLTQSHPHTAFHCAGEDIHGLMEALAAWGVPYDGPNRLGPPGQASVYFDDPFGNHLEFTASDFTGEVRIGPPDHSRLGYDWQG